MWVSMEIWWIRDLSLDHSCRPEVVDWDNWLWRVSKRLFWIASVSSSSSEKRSLSEWDIWMGVRGGSGDSVK